MTANDNARIKVQAHGRWGQKHGGFNTYVFWACKCYFKCNARHILLHVQSHKMWSYPTPHRHHLWNDDPNFLKHLWYSHRKSEVTAEIQTSESRFINVLTPEAWVQPLALSLLSPGTHPHRVAMVQSLLSAHSFSISSPSFRIKGTLFYFPLVLFDRWWISMCFVLLNLGMFFLGVEMYIGPLQLCTECPFFFLPWVVLKLYLGLGKGILPSGSFGKVWWVLLF